MHVQVALQCVSIPAQVVTVVMFTSFHIFLFSTKGIRRKAADVLILYTPVICRSDSFHKVALAGLEDKDELRGIDM